MWNIEGLSSEKANDPHFQDIVSKFSIASFVETWIGSESIQDISIPNFELVHSSSRKKHKKARRYSGGINIFAKSSISKGLKSLTNSHPDILWIKLDHMFFSISRDVFVAVVYISPEYSSYNNKNNDIESIYSILLSDVEKYSSMGDIIIQDDSEYHPDRVLSRNNLDHKHTNNSGKLLLNMCKEAKIRILNGRTIGDLNGQPTCITYNGSSVVDYTLISEELIDSIGYFVVHDFTSLSNHRPISCAMFANFLSVPCDSHQLDSLPGKFLWTDEAIASYTENIQSQMFKNKLANFIAKRFNESDSITESFNSIFLDCAKQSAKFIHKKPIQKLKKSNRKPWFLHSCTDLRNTVKSCFIHIENRRLCKHEQKMYKQKICNDINDNIEKNPKILKYAKSDNFVNDSDHNGTFPAIKR
ncbi:unnamed protein product [Mytilus edulis]|uniref:Endonuclease/exonuclease/phosphatase domain-containing protein n=1 Tax=Mytilus edulis TaxID=6550 RepID=A0A8S3QT42_MYTED|nr:unnamed protein product [Mytilus edulis]